MAHKPRIIPGAIPAGQLSFQFGDAGLERSGVPFHLGSGETWGDVLRAVPVVGNDLDEEQSLHLASERSWRELIDQFGILARIEHPGVTKEFEAGTMWIVHHEEGDPIGNAQVARADELAVALEISETNQVRSQHLYEPSRTTPVLQVGPASLTDGPHIETVARGDEVGFVRREGVGLGRFLHDLVLSEVFVLRLLYGRRENELHVFIGHGV